MIKLAKAIFSCAETSGYDDQPENRYHFPATYLRQAQRAVGDFAIYYEPRRATGPTSSDGRSSYFAVAHVDRVEPDPRRAAHYYAYVSQYLEFDNPVPFRSGLGSYESALSKPDGSTNRGAFGRSVRNFPELEFDAIVRAGLVLDASESVPGRVEEPVPEYVVRPIVQLLVSRKFRDQAFKRHVRRAYLNTCAVTGLSLVNGGGRPEVQAAHIRPVEADGPDTVRNGLALTGTIHWLFDRGLISVDDSYMILLSGHGIPDGISSLMHPSRRLLLPDSPESRPHSTYLAWHRAHRFKP